MATTEDADSLEAAVSLAAMDVDAIMVITAVAGFGLFFSFLVSVTNLWSVGNAKAFPILFLHIFI